MNTLIQRFLEGFNFKPWTPYEAPFGLRLERGIHNLFGLHRRNRGGSWCFGYDYVCECGMNVGPWSQKRREGEADAINRLPPEKQQQAAAHISGGR